LEKLPLMSVAPFEGAADAHAAPNGALTNSRIEVQLHAQIADLEARVADLSRCLEDAEQRAGEQLAIRAELLAVQARAALLEQRMAVILGSRSWRLTTPLRRIVKHVRSIASR
jgi:hypothetical protein